MVRRCGKWLGRRRIREDPQATELFLPDCSNDADTPTAEGQFWLESHCTIAVVARQGYKSKSFCSGHPTVL
jgi:hypothetical protein